MSHKRHNNNNNNNNNNNDNDNDNPFPLFLSSCLLFSLEEKNLPF